jgi:hypothetical protein
MMLGASKNAAKQFSNVVDVVISYRKMLGV